MFRRFSNHHHQDFLQLLDRYANGMLMINTLALLY
jgi:hypothetical protein